VGDNEAVAPRWQPDPGVVTRRLDDEVVLINLRTNRMFSLNRTGARAWELLQTGHDWPGVRRKLLDEFDVAPATLDRELGTLSASLALEGFAARDDPRATTRATSAAGESGRDRTLRAGRRATVSLVARMGAWSLVLPALKHLLPLPRVVRLMARGSAGARSRDRERLVERIAGRIYRGRKPGTCLERSLLAYRYLSDANAEPQLVIGVRRDERDVLGHAWVLVDGAPVYEASETLSMFLPVVTFDARGDATTAIDASARASF
jgi:hypothetical protein